MKKIFSLKTMMLILIGFGIFFILAGMNAFEYGHKIDGCGYLFVGTSFIITGTSLLVKLKE